MGENFAALKEIRSFLGVFYFFCLNGAPLVPRPVSKGFVMVTPTCLLIGCLSCSTRVLPNSTTNPVLILAAPWCSSRKLSMNNLLLQSQNTNLSPNYFETSIILSLYRWSQRIGFFWTIFETKPLKTFGCGNFFYYVYIIIQNGGLIIDSFSLGDFR